MDLDSKEKLMLPNLRYFTDSDSMIKDIIVHHGENTCRNKFEKSMISKTVQKCDFGFVSFTKRANIGQKKKSKSAEYTVHGFILCREENFSVFISLICVSNQHKGAGSELLSNVIDYARNQSEILRVTLHALPELQSYYQKHKFDTVDTLRTTSGEVKVYQMSLRL